MAQEEIYVYLLHSQLVAAHNLAARLSMISEHDLYAMHREHLEAFIERLRVDLKRCGDEGV